VVPGRFSGRPPCGRGRVFVQAGRPTTGHAPPVLAPTGQCRRVGAPSSWRVATALTDAAPVVPLGRSIAAGSSVVALAAPLTTSAGRTGRSPARRASLGPRPPVALGTCTSLWLVGPTPLGAAAAGASCAAGASRGRGTRATR
jgi:hypothetical protein